MSNEFEAYKIYVQSARKSLFKTKNSNLKFVNLKTKFISYINDMT